MKKLSTIIIFAGLTFNSFAGEPVNGTNSLLSSGKGDGEKCFDESTHIINAGIGVGSGDYYRYGGGGEYSSSPALSICYEQPWSKKLGPGFLGIGAYLGFQTTHYRYNYNAYYGSFNSNAYHYEERRSYYSVCGRAAYHWDVLNSGKAEVYAGVLIGVRFRTYSYEDNDPNVDNSNAGAAVYPAYGVYAGARWYFAKNVGVYGEVGYGISYATIGISFKF